MSGGVGVDLVGAIGRLSPLVLKPIRTASGLHQHQTVLSICIIEDACICLMLYLLYQPDKDRQVGSARREHYIRHIVFSRITESVVHSRTFRILPYYNQTVHDCRLRYKDCFLFLNSPLLPSLHSTSFHFYSLLFLLPLTFTSSMKVQLILAALVSLANIANADCSDLFVECHVWKDAGLCSNTQYTKLMKQYCAESCGFWYVSPSLLPTLANFPTVNVQVDLDPSCTGQSSMLDGHPCTPYTH